MGNFAGWLLNYEQHCTSFFENITLNRYGDVIKSNFLKILANLRAKFGVPMTFGLAVT